MKMFKKLMAVVLAGVLTLTVLTGCGASFDKKELVAIFNDRGARTGFNKVEYTDAGTDQADKIIPLVQKAYDETDADKKVDFDPMEALYNEEDHAYTEVKKALGITDETKDQYSFNIVKVRQYNSQYNQDHATMMLAAEITSTCRSLNRVNADGNKGTVSMNTVNLGGNEYIVVVFKVIA